ncbi:hypothetical protein JCM17960_19810 [Magnetospira thiophila]
MSDLPSPTIRVLVIEDNPGDAILVREYLSDVALTRYETVIEASLEAGMKRAEEETFDAVLLDLSLPDSVGAKTVAWARAQLPHVPLIVLTGTDDEETAMLVLREGAQDYLVKDDVAPSILDRTIRYAIERARTERTMTQYISELENSRRSLQQQAERLEKLTLEYASEKEKAEAADRSKSEFLATMSHEIRTPLTGVLGMTDLLLGMELSSQARDYVGMIRESGEMLLRILNDVLDMSRLQAGRLELDQIDFNLHSLVRDLYSLMWPKAQEKELDFQLHLVEGLPEGVNADPVRIRQILFNLTGNALKFTPAGQVRIAVSHSPDSEGGVLLLFEVSDSGIGIPEDLHSHLFQRFSQADASTARRFGGSGLGLAICRHLAELMGGEIGFDSELGVGSRFWFTVPCTIAEAPGEKQESRRVYKYRAQRPLRILVAEDNRINQKLIVNMLQPLGHRVYLADNGIEAIKLVETRELDLVLMDVRMPEMDGLDATRAIRRMDSNRAQLPVIAVTADAMESHLRGFLEAGMNASVVKPIDFNTMLEVINQAMGEEVHLRDVQVTLPPETAATKESERVEQAGPALSAFLDHLTELTRK